MTATEFVRRYPLLYHRTPAINLPGIRLHGLLSTTALLARYGVSSAQAVAIEASRARVGVVVPPPVDHPDWPAVQISDQHQIHPPQMADALDGVTPSAWRAILNARVFFWPTRERLQVMQKTYAKHAGYVLVIDSERLIAQHAERLLLSHINTGYFRRKPAKRSPATYQPLSQFPYSARQKVAEVSLLDGLPDVWEFVQELIEV